MKYNDYPRVVRDMLPHPPEAPPEKIWQPEVKNNLHNKFQYTVVDARGWTWLVHSIQKDDQPGTLAYAPLAKVGDTYVSFLTKVDGRCLNTSKHVVVMKPYLLTKEQVTELLNGDLSEAVESTHDPLDPYTPEDRKRYNEETWARNRKRLDEAGVAAFRGPFIGPWIEHSDHRYSRSWHPSVMGGGPAAVVQGSGSRYHWFAWHCLLGFGTGEVRDETGHDVSRKAMAAADAFLAEEEEYVRPNGHTTYYPLEVVVRIEASPWKLERAADDQWIRTWKDWPDEKALAARVSRRGEEYYFVCWGIYSEGHIGYGPAETLEKAKRLAEDTLRAYCTASEGLT